jgi:hypothetical protein
MTLHKGENPYIYGFHDAGGEHVLIENGEPKGWVLVTEAIGADPNAQGGGNYTGITNQGLGLIVRLNQDYGPNGTIPREELYPQFAQRCANFVAGSQGAHIWLIGNEMNFEREQPRLAGSVQAEPITPRRYARCYKMVRDKIKSVSGHENDLVVVGAIGPWNAQTPYDADPDGKYPANKIPGAPGEYPYEGSWGDFIRYFHDILVSIGPENCDAIAIHAYSHGYDANLVFSDAKMGAPFDKYYYHFRTYQDQMNAIPENMRHLPVYLTEMNGDKEPDGSTWPFGNNGWIKNAYKEIDDWNQSGKQQIRCGILFRWIIDPHGWSIDGKTDVQQDLREAMTKNYTWDPEASQPEPEPDPDDSVHTNVTPEPEPSGPAIPRPEVPGYRVRYLKHNTPATIEAGQDVVVTITMMNAGSFNWVATGQNPFRLGFQWYNAAGQFVQFPSQLDYRTALPQDVAPNGQVTVQARLRTPATPGTYQLRWDMVHEMVTWFTTQGDAGLLVSPIAVKQPVAPQPQPQPHPQPEPQPEPQPQPAVAHITIQNIINQLETHPSRRYRKRPLDAIKRIIIHHTVTPPQVTPQRIAEFQVKNKDLPGITYHFCTTHTGTAFQTQALTTTAAHAGQNSWDSLGVCLIGNFMESPPSDAQINATASVIAQLVKALKLSTDQVFGYSELVNTQSPGATWPQWKPKLLAAVSTLLGESAPAPDRSTASTPSTKPIEHYVLFWYKSPDNWAEWDWRGARSYIERFRPTAGFSVEEAQFAKYVTIVGGPGGVSAEAEALLKNAGCKVERISGKSETETRRILEEMATKGHRFRTLA